MARRNSRQSFRRRTPRKVRRWTAQGASFVLLPNTLAFVTLTSPADYRQQNTLEPSGVTLARIRLSWSIFNLSAALAASLSWAVFAHDADETPVVGGLMDPDVSTANGIQQLIDQEVLAHGVVQLTGATAGGTSCLPGFTIDVKAMRKLSDSSVSLVVVANAGIGPATTQHLVGARLLLLGG